MDLSNENIIHVKSGELEYIQFKRLLEYENITHAFSLKPHNFREKDRIKLINNYEQILNKIGLSIESLVKPSQEHTDNVIIVDKKERENFPDYDLEYLKSIDGIITSSKNITLATTNADCVLMIFYDPIKNVIANIHSGWRGTFKKIAEVTVKKMKEDKGCNPADIIVGILPSIRVCHFEVHDDVKKECENIFLYTGKLDEIIRPAGEDEQGKKYYIDTVLINKILLTDQGIKEENILDSGICSMCYSEQIHSRRVEGPDYGVGTAIISLK